MSEFANAVARLRALRPELGCQIEDMRDRIEYLRNEIEGLEGEICWLKELGEEVEGVAGVAERVEDYDTRQQLEPLCHRLNETYSAYGVEEFVAILDDLLEAYRAEWADVPDQRDQLVMWEATP